MKERPIIFSAPMVRAILEGRKTMTRRVMKIQPYESEYEPGLFHMMYKDKKGHPVSASGTKDMFLPFCPHGIIGDRLWVRETFAYGMSTKSGIAYRSTSKWSDFEDGTPQNYETITWKPSIYMPRWASRITLEITNVSVERLNDIGEEDAIQEGIQEENVIIGATCAGGMHREITEIRFFFDGGKEEGYEDGVSAYRALWESINGPGSWDANPWVWVIEFKRVEA